MMGWELIVKIILGAIPSIFSVGFYKFANDNLNDLKIPDNIDSFNNHYARLLDKILKNNLDSLSKYLEDIVNQNNDLVDENSFNSIDIQELFFLDIEQNLLFKTYKYEIRELYDLLIDTKKKINNLFTCLFFVSFVTLCLVFIYNELVLSIAIMCILYIVFEIIRSWKEFNNVVFKISRIIIEIDKTYDRIPQWFGDKYGN